MLRHRYFAILSLAVGLLFVVLPWQIGRSAMSGSSYAVPWDVISTSGDEAITGSSYGLRSTQGEIVGGESAGLSYGVRAGYRQEEEPFMEANLSVNVCNLGVLDPSSVDGCRLTSTVITNAPGGFITTVLGSVGGVNDGNGNNINAVSDGSITFGSEEYGVSTEDTDADVAQFSGGDITSANCTTDLAGPLLLFTALSSVTSKSIRTESAPNLNSVTDICIAASVSTSTIAGTYTDSLTIITTGTF